MQSRHDAFDGMPWGQWSWWWAATWTLSADGPTPISGATGSTLLLTIADVGLALVIFVVLWRIVGMPFDAAFDRGYYIAVLSFLWMHYYQDHFLFVHPEVIEGKSLA